MSDSFVRVPPDSSGKRIQSFENTIDGDIVQAQAVTVVDSSGSEIEVARVSRVSTVNSTSAALGGAGVFAGEWEDVSGCESVVVALLTDADGTMQIQFSPDGTNADSTLSFSVTANTNEVHRITATRRYFRVVYTNGAAAQSFFRMQSTCGAKQLLSSTLNSVVQSDADAVVVRSVTEETLIAEGKYEGRSIVNKFGRNSSISSGSVPEDVWNGGGVYTGFPTGAADTFEAVSSSAGDTGVLTITYLPSFTATAWLTASATLSGLTPVSFGVSGVRMHTASYSSGSATTFNVGTITVRHVATPANIFCVMPIGRSQTNVAAYTVPAGYTGYVKRIFARVIGVASGTVGGALWVRTLNGSPRLRRPFSCTQSDFFEELPYGGLVVSAGSDITVRITDSSATVDVIAGFDVVIVKN